MDKTCYRNYNAYSECKSTSVIAEERKSSKMNKISETNKSKDNICGSSDPGNNKNKGYKKNKKDQQINTNSIANKK